MRIGTTESRGVVLMALLLCGICAAVLAQDKVLLVPFHAKNGWGYSDTLANVVIKPEAYDSVEFFDWYALAKVYRGGKINVIDAQGKRLLKEDCESIMSHGGAVWQLVNNKMVGLYDAEKRRYVLDVLYDNVQTYNDKVRVVIKKQKFALFTTAGIQLTPFKFDSIADQFNDYMVAYVGRKLFEINYADGKITPVKKVRISEGTGDVLGFAEVAPGDEERNTATQEFVDRIKREYTLDSMNATPIDFGGVFGSRIYVYQVYAKGKTAYLFWNERRIMSIKYAALSELYLDNGQFSMIAALGGKYGVINQDEQVLVPFQYDGLHTLTPSFVYTINAGKTGVWIFNTVYPPIKCHYDSVKLETRLNVHSRWSFVIFRVKKGNTWGYVGENGVEYFE
ncbi:WG repeat-containing protein [Pseudochryseolinea flava]|uniref:WG repeat-containing protein n=1 Tax=Pseudochryseolinea flava TaxID=2059302 RepID=A0A364XW22_9BACT|nr:WG repeat-containing protein [Pseudochryseolinea flava]RAV97711.1 hypothetical protein DQQ10_27110 [Pseudochryseolinea flava]